MQQAIDDGEDRAGPSAAQDRNSTTLGDVLPDTEKSAAFFEAESSSSDDLPEIRLTDKSGNPVEGNEFSEGYLVFRMPNADETRRVPVEKCERPVALPVVFSYDFSQSGGHNSKDYWNLHQSFEVHAQFVLAADEGTLRHLLTLVTIPQDKIAAGGVNMHPEAEMVADLKTRAIPGVVRAIGALSFNGMDLSSAEAALKTLNTSPYNMRVETGSLYSL